MAIVVNTSGWPLNLAKPAQITSGVWCFEFTPNYSSSGISTTKRMFQIGTGTAEPTSASGMVGTYGFLGSPYVVFKWDANGGNGTAINATWSANQKMTLWVDTTGSGRIQLYGATTGNGSLAMVGSKSFPSGNMYVGSDSGGGHAFTGTLSNVYDFDGVVAGAEAGLTGSAVGAMTITGTVAGVRDGLTAAAAGSERFNATAAGVEAGLTASATGSTGPITGTVAGAEAGLTAAAAGAQTITGSASYLTTATPVPSTVAAPAFMRTGRFRFTFTASSLPGGAYYLFDIGTGGDRIEVNGDSSGLFLEIGGAFIIGPSTSWSIGQPVTVDVDWSARLLTITGATTGDGTYAITGSGTWPSGTMGIGIDSASATAPFPGTITNLQDFGTGPQEASLVAAVAGSMRFNATAAGVEAGLTGAAVGAQTITGAVAGALPGLIATVVSSGAVAGAEAGLVAAVAGAMTFVGTVAGSHSGLTGAASGSERMAATVAGLHDGLTAAAAGSERITGTVAGVEPGLIAFAPSNNDVVGTVAGLMSGLTGVMYGGGALVAGVEAGLTAAAAGALTITGVVAGAHAGLTAAVDALRINATVAGVHDGLTAAAAGSERITGTVAGAHAGLVAAVNARRYTGVIAGVLGQGAFEAGLAITSIPALSTTPVYMRTGRWRFSFSQRVGASTGGSSILFESASTGDRLTVNNNLDAIFLEAGGNFVAFTDGSFVMPQGQTVTVDIDWVNRTMTVSGATAGNGAFTVSSGSSWPSGTLGIGQPSGGGAAFDGTISSVEQWGINTQIAAVRTPLIGVVAGVLPGLVAATAPIVRNPVTGVIAGVLPGLVGFATDFVPLQGPPGSGAFADAEYQPAVADSGSEPFSGGFGSSGTYPAAEADSTSEPQSGGFSNAVYPPRTLP